MNAFLKTNSIILGLVFLSQFAFGTCPDSLFQENDPTSARQELMAMEEAGELNTGASLRMLSNNALKCLDYQGLAPDLIERLIITEHIKAATTILKTEFIAPWHPFIDMAMRAAYLIKIRKAGAPAIIPIGSSWGYGKSTFVSRVRAVLGVTQGFEAHGIEEDELEFPTEILRRHGVLEGQEVYDPSIIYISEIGQLIDQGRILEAASKFPIRTLAKALGKDLKTTVDSGSITLTDDEKKEALNLIRKKSIAQIREILGNGKFNRKSDPLASTVSEHLQAIEERIFNYLAFDSMPEGDRGTMNKYSLRQVAVGKIVTFIEEHPTAFRGINISSPQTFFENLLDDERRIEIFNLIQENTQNFPSNVEDLRHLLIFVDFNLDKEMLDSITRSGAEGPDALHDDMKKNITSDKILSWFRNKLGYDPAFESRLGVRDWQILLPYTKQQWREFFTQRFHIMAADLKKSLENRSGLDINNIDISIGDEVYRLFEQFISVDEAGLRRFFIQGGHSAVMGIGEDLTNKIVQLRREINGDIQIHLTTENREGKEYLVAQHVSHQFEDEETQESSEKTPSAQQQTLQELARVDVTVKRESSDQDLNSKRATETAEIMALHQAAAATVGMAMLGSVPNSISRQTNYGDHMFANGWEQVSQTHMTEVVRGVMSLSGIAAYELFRSGDFAPHFEQADTVVTDEVIQRLQTDLQTRLQRIQLQPQLQSENQQSNSPAVSTNIDWANASQLIKSSLSVVRPKASSEADAIRTREGPNIAISSIFSRQILKAEFYQAINDIGRNSDGTIDPVGVKNATLIMYQAALDILENEKNLVSIIASKLQNQTNLSAREIKALVEEYGSDTQLKGQLIQSNPGQQVSVVDPAFQTPQSSELVIRKKGRLSRFMNVIGALSLSFLIGGPAPINDIDRMAQACTEVQILDSRGNISHRVMDPTNFDTLLQDPRYKTPEIHSSTSSSGASQCALVLEPKGQNKGWIDKIFN